MLTDNELAALYHSSSSETQPAKWPYFDKLRQFEKSSEYLFFTNYFDIPLAHLLAVLIDRADAGADAAVAQKAGFLSNSAHQSLSLRMQSEDPSLTGTGYIHFRSDMFAALDYNYDTEAFGKRRGWFFPPLIDDPGKYVHRQPHLKQWLRQVRKSGVRVLIATNSHIEFTSLLLTHTFSEDSATGTSTNSWRKAVAGCLDLLIVNSRKPRWFTGAGADSRMQEPPVKPQTGANRGEGGQ